MNMNRHTSLLAAIFCLASVGAAQDRRSDRSFSWDGSMSAGRTLYIRNLSGAIRVERASGSKAEVQGEKRWRRGDPEDVRIEMKKVGDDVLICALWNDRTECDTEGYRTRGDNYGDRRSNDTSVEFTVRLPAGVKLVASTVNGGLDISGATAEVEASTINGSVEASSSGGPVRATTVNGSITVRMKELGDKDLDFETVNGGIEVWVPDNINADVDLRTVNGRVESDFPMTVSGRINPRRLRATIGKGGQRLRFSTVNGSIELRKN